MVGEHGRPGNSESYAVDPGRDGALTAAGPKTRTLPNSRSALRRGPHPLWNRALLRRAGCGLGVGPGEELGSRVILTPQCGCGRGRGRVCVWVGEDRLGVSGCVDVWAGACM
jgi:hypothetical protein